MRIVCLNIDGRKKFNARGKRKNEIIDDRKKNEETAEKKKPFANKNQFIVFQSNSFVDSKILALERTEIV